MIIRQSGFIDTNIVYWHPSLWKSFSSYSGMCAVPTFRIDN